jgi:hypothetical protein
LSNVESCGDAICRFAGGTTMLAASKVNPADGKIAVTSSF